MSVPDYDIYEHYSINGYNIRRLVASQQPDFTSPGTFAERRSNFMGFPMKTMMDDDYSYTKLHTDGNLHEDKYDPVMEAYKLEHSEGGPPIAEGMLGGILVMMSQSLNFTIEAYVRKDRIWGTAIVSTCN